MTSLLPSHAMIAVLATLVLVGAIASEARFLVRYRRLIVPRANEIPVGPPAPYRDYPDVSDRVDLLVRILDRILERARDNDDGRDRDDEAGRRRRELEAAYEFVESWFVRKKGRRDGDDAPYELFSGRLDAATLDAGLCPPRPPTMRWSLFSSGDGSVGEDEVVDEGGKDVPSVGRTTTKATKGRDRIRRGNMDEFLSWAFFGTSHSALSPDATLALDGLYDALRERAGLTFEPGTDPNYVPRTFTLEGVNSLYRPLCTYAAWG